MLNIDSLERGIVIDHIKAGCSMKIYHLLNLDELDCCVAVIKNAKSRKLGKKDIIKIDDMVDLDLEILGFIDPNITINVIDEGRIIEKKQMILPARLKNVIQCKNPRCITSIEEEIEHMFYLTDEEKHHYRCVYCEQEYQA